MRRLAEELLAYTQSATLPYYQMVEHYQMVLANNHRWIGPAPNDQQILLHATYEQSINLDGTLRQNIQVDGLY